MRTHFFAIVAAAALLAAPAAHARTFFLTVAGLGGEPDYEQRFTSLARELDKLFRAASPGSDVETLDGAKATKTNLTARLDSFANQAKPDDDVVLTLIGHGTFDGYQYKFNLPGRDITAQELGALLDRIPTARQLVVNATSSSGGAVESLRRRNRVVVSATRRGTERNATVFARYWVEALRTAAADSHKNDSISALEAFRYADAKTTQFYETAKRLATEHAVLEDTGSGEGVRDPSPANGTGKLAQQYIVVRIGSAQKAMGDPAKQKLLARKEQIEQSIDALKYEKAALPLEEYRKKMTQLLLQLARVQEEIDR
jgi:hypothetical protein